MNVHGLKQKLKKERELIKKERNKGRYDFDPEKIKRIEGGMENLREKIMELRQNKKRKK